VHRNADLAQAELDPEEDEKVDEEQVERILSAWETSEMRRKELSFLFKDNKDSRDESDEANGDRTSESDSSSGNEEAPKRVEKRAKTAPLWLQVRCEKCLHNATYQRPLSCTIAVGAHGADVAPQLAGPDAFLGNALAVRFVRCDGWGHLVAPSGQHRHTSRPTWRDLVPSAHRWLRTFLCARSRQYVNILVVTS
jgi:ribosomal protein L44E